MTYDVFASQRRAKGWTWLMVLFFCLGLIAIVVAAHYTILGSIFIVLYALDSVQLFEFLQQWRVLVLAFLGTLVLVSLGVRAKISALYASGGQGIAKAMGGRPVPPDTAAPAERKLRNVVEEMALAAGMPVPEIYVLGYEEGINAFAAGFDANSAVLGVTRGAMELLNREELQGLVAHEFSHMADGDMRLNTRLMGWVYGIKMLYLIWYVLVPDPPERIEDETGVRGSLTLFILALFAQYGGWLLLVAGRILGAGGAFFGNCIKASVCRNREYLADTMAVRFTRNPLGLAQALMKIGGYDHASRLKHPAAAQVSHMCFSQCAGRFGSILATHPPLVKRIRRLNPSFSEQDFPLVDEQTRRNVAAEDMGALFTMSPEETRRVGQMVSSSMPVGAALDQAIPYARSIIASLPPAVSEAARKPESAAALVLALLIEHDPRQNQDLLDLLTVIADKPTHDRVAVLLPEIAEVRDNARLPIIDLCIPALREMTPEQHRQFSAMVQQLIVADNRMDLMEWALATLLKRHLDGHFKPVRRTRGLMITSLEAVRPESAVLLSVLAKLGRPDTADRQRAFAAGAKALCLDDLPLPDKSEQTLTNVDKALKRLNWLDSPYKSILLKACATCITADQEVTIKQGELLRVVADSLGCPMPPFLPGQTLTQEPQP